MKAARLKTIVFWFKDKVSSMDTGIMGWSSMDNVLALSWQLLHFFQVMIYSNLIRLHHQLKENAFAVNCCEGKRYVAF